MYNYNLITLLERVLGNGYKLKNGEIAFHCKFCNHHKKKLQINLENQKWHCWVCNSGGQKIVQLLKKLNVSQNIVKNVIRKHPKPDWAVQWVPHGINEKHFYPLIYFVSQCIVFLQFMT